MLRRLVKFATEYNHIRKFSHDPNKNPTKEALINHTHDLRATNLYCCGTGCNDCVWVLYLNSLDLHLKTISDPTNRHKELDEKLKGAERWIQLVIKDDMHFRGAID